MTMREMMKKLEDRQVMPPPAAPPPAVRYFPQKYHENAGTDDEFLEWE